MSKWFVVAIVSLGFFFAAPLAAQGGGGGQGGGGAGGGGKGNWGKGKQYKGPNSNGNGQGNGQGGQGGDDWQKKAENEIGWGEDGTEERVLPGDTVKDDAKETRLNAEADKLGLTDKKLRKDFIKYGKLGWEKAEKEDARWAKEVKKVKDDAAAMEKARAEHKTKLDEAWAGPDEDQVKKEILTSEQLETFKKNTADLRTETATDKSLKQDEIRARKVDEIKKRAADWAKANGGGDKEDNEVKKEKKEAEGEEKEEEKKD